MYRGNKTGYKMCSKLFHLRGRKNIFKWFLNVATILQFLHCYDLSAYFINVALESTDIFDT